MQNSQRLSKLESVYKSLDLLTRFLNPALPFLNSHNIDFIIKSHWTKFLPQKLQDDLELLPVSVPLLKSHIKDLSLGKWNHANDHKPLIDFEACSLDDIVSQIGQFGLRNMKMSLLLDEIPLLNVKNVEEMIHLNLSEQELKFDPFMSPKKMHEVEIMGNLIYRIAKYENFKPDTYSSLTDNDVGMIERLIDIGSGKGYLSSFLSLLYKFDVYAIDSSAGNTTGSSERAARLQRVWAQLLRRAMERAETGHAVRRGKYWKRRMNKAAQTTTEVGLQNQNLKDDVKLLVMEGRNNEGEGAPLNQEILNHRLRNMTLYVTRNLNLKEFISTQSNGEQSNQKKLSLDFGIIGLHTCGPLGVDSIHLFLQDGAKFLCNVPCCYHHLEEVVFPSTALEVNTPYSRSKEKQRKSNFWDADEKSTITSPTFPLSRHLQAQEFNLGRNARMLSSYSFQRMSHELENSELNKPMIWRLLLQVIIAEKLGHTLLDYHVGKLGNKCSTFQEYVKKALQKLHLDNNIQVSDEEIELIYKRYEPSLEKFYCYFILRTMFGPLIEGCILLDRLAYLLEQEQVEDAYIVELFDPFLSPRCNAIIATKKSRTSQEKPT